MLYDSYHRALSDAQFTFDRLASFKHEASTSGALVRSPELSEKVEEIIRDGILNFERFDDYKHHDVARQHLYSHKDPQIYKAMRVAMGQQAKPEYGVLLSDTAKLSVLLGNLREFRGKAVAMLSSYESWRDELAGQRRLNAGEEELLEEIKETVLPALKTVIDKIDKVIRDFMDEERERYRRLQTLGNMIYIMRGGFTGRFARFNPNRVVDKAAAAAAAAAATDVDEKAELEKKLKAAEALEQAQQQQQQTQAPLQTEPEQATQEQEQKKTASPQLERGGSGRERKPEEA